MDTFTFRMVAPVKVQNAGLFISRGKGIHPTRVISSHELIFVKNGQLEMWEEEETFTVKQGQTLHLWPERRHGGLTPLNSDLRFYWIHFEVPKPSSAIPTDAPLFTVPQVHDVTRPEKLEELFRLFLVEQESGDLNPFTANLLMTLMLVETSRPVKPARAEQDEINVIATRAHTFIRLNFDRPISACIIAEALGYNPDYLGRVYHKVFNCTITEAIHRRRIKTACKHLLEGEMTVEQIATTCGFSNPDYFRRIFRRQMDMSPTEYRDVFTHVHMNTH